MNKSMSALTNQPAKNAELNLTSESLKAVAAAFREIGIKAEYTTINGRKVRMFRLGNGKSLYTVIQTYHRGFKKEVCYGDVGKIVEHDFAIDGGKIPPGGFCRDSIAVVEHPDKNPGVFFIEAVIWDGVFSHIYDDLAYVPNTLEEGKTFIQWLVKQKNWKKDKYELAAKYNRVITPEDSK